MLLKIVLGTALFLGPIRALQNHYCQLSCDFVVQTFTHTVCNRQNMKCGPHEQCGPDFKIIHLDDYQREYIVNLHNYLRNKVAIGNETRGNQPPASNMKTMTYNPELEFIAQCWANTCNGNPLIHDVCRRTAEYEHVGQNLGFINSSVPDINISKSIEELIMLWYDEVEIFNNEWVNDTQDRGAQYKVGHYTQMLWADSHEIGCAIAYYTTQSSAWHHIVLVCNYAPGGNYLGLPIYNVGPPNSNCNEQPNDIYPGLCGKSKTIKDIKTNYQNIFEY